MSTLTTFTRSTGILNSSAAVAAKTVYAPCPISTALDRTSTVSSSCTFTIAAADIGTRLYLFPTAIPLPRFIFPESPSEGPHAFIASFTWRRQSFTPTLSMVSPEALISPSSKQFLSLNSIGSIPSFCAAMSIWFSIAHMGCLAPNPRWHAVMGLFV